MNTPFPRRDTEASRAQFNPAVRRADATPVALPYDAQLLAPAELLRITLERRRHHYSDPHLERFALQLFADDNLVWAYFFPRAVTSGSSGSPNRHYQPIAPVSQLDMKTVWTPLEVATAAADQARSLALVLPHEREFIHLATLVFPCALFHCVRSTVMGGYDRIAPSPDWLIHMRGLFVAEALHTLRSQEPAMADTLSAVLGLPGEGDTHPEQVSRLASAVRLTHLQTQAIWATSRV
ncbi:MAG: hypothetical protein ACREBY_01915 [Polaromonas sp.]